MRRNVAIFGFLAAAVLLLTTTFAAAETCFKEMLADPADGAFDMSRFIKTRTGFVRSWRPSPSPRWGTGSREGSCFFHREEGEPPPDPPPAGEGRTTAPSLTFIGGLATENGSWGVFGAHRGAWKGDRIRYLRQDGVRISCCVDVVHGTAPCRHPTSPATIELRTVTFLQDIGVRIPGSDFFAGLRYVFVSSEMHLEEPGEGHSRRHRPGVDGEFEDPRGLIPCFFEYDSPGQHLNAQTPWHPREGFPGLIRRRSPTQWNFTNTRECGP